MIKSFSQIEKLLDQFDPEPSHARQVTRLALQLFDQTGELHRFGEIERQFLQAAALLHDIGWSEGQKGHHKTSMKMILQHNFTGWSENEKLIIANIARYHRKGLPSQTHEPYARLSKKDQHRVAKLAALLRIADALDRSHQNAVHTITCKHKKNVLELALEVRSDPTIELAVLEIKSDLLWEYYGLAVRVETVHGTD